MIDIHLISQCTIEPEVDCLIIPAFEDALNEAVSSKLILPEDKTILDLLIEKGNIDGKDNFYLPTPLSPYQSIMILGLGKKSELKASTFRENSGKCSKSFQKLKKTHLLLEMAQASDVINAEQFVEAIVLGQYSYDEFKDIPEDKKPVNINEICIHVKDDVDITIEQAKINLAQTKCESANWARNLANKPGNALTPTILAQEAEAMAKETGAEFEVFDEKKMKSLGMNSLLAVSQGSDEEAKLIFIKHTHPDAKKTIAIVGKGLTFDAGGISLKPGKGMQEMKFDMCGAAAVLGAMRNICIIKPAVNVICVVPSSENLINGKAVKPGDIVKAYNGKTIEIYNTDAEGRLILADAMAYTAEKYKPDMMVDLATLTGACIVALGHHLGGLMSKDEEMVDALT
ncbi:MAG: leucyl aminopeptidase, partial [Lentisphaeraceae bacterium]|nr:leucyl aminopeptidase [Lentisphaeraceae bacterium]